MAITELNEFEVAAAHSADGVTSVRKMAARACSDELARRKLKACAEAFLAKSVVCEGKTELGIVRALEEAGRAHLSLRGVAPVDANGGAEMFKLARLMNSCGCRTCVFVDSDERNYDGDKKALRSEGVQVFDWDEGVSTELQVFNDVPDETVRNLASLAVDEWDAGRVGDSPERNGLSYDDAGCARVGADGCRGFARGRSPATSGRFRRKRAPISPWVLGFCAVFCGSCSPSAPPTWGNAGAGWRFEPIRPAKPPRSCKRGSLALKVAHLDACFDSVGAGRHSRTDKRLKPAGVQSISCKLVWWRGECGHVN